MLDMKLLMIYEHPIFANSCINFFLKFPGASTSSTGFVTFNDLCTVTAAASAPLTVEPNVLIVAIAPEPRDLIFENIVVDLDTVEAKKKSASLLVAFGALLWSVPVAAIQIWCTSDSLCKLFFS